MPNLFWSQFYNLCIQKGTKPNPVAKALNISSGVVTKWKNESALPNGDNLAKIADYLDCSVDYLLGRASAPASFYGDGFTAHDKALVDAYKKQPDIRPAVDKLLGLNGKPAYDFSGMDLSGAAIAAFGGTTSADDSADYSAISELLSNKDKEL